MPKDYYRIEAKLPEDLSLKLTKLASDVTERTGSHVSRNQLLVEIVRHFFDSSKPFETLSEELQKKM
jgi:hypothetical protein